MYLLNILGLEYESKYIDTKAQEHKQPPYLQLNPNGRLPTLVDHKNNDYTVWCVSYEVDTLVIVFHSSASRFRESAAILLYLVDNYDPEKRLTSTNAKEKYQIVQWLLFQSSGQRYDCTQPFIRASS